MEGEASSDLQALPVQHNIGKGFFPQGPLPTTPGLVTGGNKTYKPQQQNLVLLESLAL